MEEIVNYLGIENVIVLKDTNEKIVDIKIPDEAVAIKDWAFDRCWDLKEVYLPDSIRIIGVNSFSLCENLKKISLPKQLESVDKRSFDGSNNLEYIEFRGTREEFIEKSFWNVKSPTRIIHCSDGDAKLNDFFIDEDSGLTCLNPGIVDAKIPDGVVSINVKAFQHCDNLQSVVLSDSVKNIGEYAFYRCANLKKVKLPDSVRVIDCRAFSGCKNLKKISFSEELEFISEYAFDGCSRLKHIYFRGTMKVWESKKIIFNDEDIHDVFVHCTDGNVVFKAT